MVRDGTCLGTFASEAGLLLSAVAVLIAATWWMGPFIPDDAYISFRYAHNWAVHGVLGFNLDGAPVEGYSNFAWICVLALAIRLGFSPVTIAPVLGVLCSVATLVYVHALMRRMQPLRATQWIGLLAASLSAPLLLYSISGLETSLFALLLLAAIYHSSDFSITQSRTAAALTLLACVLAALCRPEGAIVAPVILLTVLAQERRSLLPSELLAKWRWLIIAYALFLVLSTAVRYDYFGRFFPTPLLSKHGGQTALWQVWLKFLRYSFVRQDAYFVPFGMYHLALWALAAASIAFARAAGGMAIQGWLCMVLGTALGLLYANFVDWMPGMRYYAPLAPLFVVASVPLLDRVLTNFDPDARRRHAPVVVAATVLTCCGNLFLISALRLEASQNELANRESLVQLGYWAGQEFDSTTLIATSDVGAVAFHSGLNVLDIDPESLTDAYLAENGWSSEYVLDKAPHVFMLVSRSFTTPRFSKYHEALVAHPRFRADYHAIGVVRNNWHGDRSLWVYLRNDIVPSRGAVTRLPRGIGHGENPWLQSAALQPSSSAAPSLQRVDKGSVAD